MDDNVEEIKMVENGLIITLLFVILIILFPSATNLMSKSLILSAQTSTQNTLNMVEEIYLNINLEDDINLPFEVVFNINGYEIYSNGTIYTPKKEIKIETKGKLPISGSIKIDTDGSRTINNLKFGVVKCNQKVNEELVCKI